MDAIRYQIFDAVLPDGDAMLRLAENFGSYGMYHVESIEDDFGENIAQRQDALQNFIETGGRFGRTESLRALAARTNYFRETYAYGEPLTPGIDSFLQHAGFHAAARGIFDRKVVLPAIVYANILVPGQELAVHTDVPEFRGINRTKDPQWLIVAMHHSGLFERWRMPIATAVAWFGHPNGGDFVFYPEGASGPPVTLPARHNTAILLDTDSVFHGVDRVSEARGAIAPLEKGMKLAFHPDGLWRVGFEGRSVAEYSWNDLRFSISWKAHCFSDESERKAVQEHTDDLDRRQVLAVLADDLRQRGRIGSGHLGDTELARALIAHYIQFPPAAPALRGQDG